MRFTSVYVDDDQIAATKDIEGWDRIPPEEQARLKRVADSPSSSRDRPSMLLRLRATKDQKHVRLDIALGAPHSSRSAPPTAKLDVRRNALAARSVEARVAGLFSTSTGQTSFQSFADADLDNDGRIDPRELEQAPVSTAEARDAHLSTFNANTATLLLARLQTTLLHLRP
jgi:hypothetical protein